MSHMDPTVKYFPFFLPHPNVQLFFFFSQRTLPSFSFSFSFFFFSSLSPNLSSSPPFHVLLPSPSSLPLLSTSRYPLLSHTLFLSFFLFLFNSSSFFFLYHNLLLLHDPPSWSRLWPSSSFPPQPRSWPLSLTLHRGRDLPPPLPHLPRPPPPTPACVSFYGLLLLLVSSSSSSFHLLFCWSLLRFVVAGRERE